MQKPCRTTMKKKDILTALILDWEWFMQNPCKQKTKMQNEGRMIGNGQMTVPLSTSTTPLLMKGPPLHLQARI